MSLWTHEQMRVMVECIRSLAVLTAAAGSGRSMPARAVSWVLASTHQAPCWIVDPNFAPAPQGRAEWLSPAVEAPGVTVHTGSCLPGARSGGMSTKALTGVFRGDTPGL